LFGFSWASETVQNTIFAMFTGLSATAIIGIGYTTWTFMKRKKEKILEAGATPVSLFPAYLKALMATMTLLGITASAFIKMNSLIRAVRDVSNMAESVMGQPSKNCAKRGKVEEVQFNVSNILPQYESKTIIMSENTMYAFYASKENYNDGRVLRGSDKLHLMYQNILTTLKTAQSELSFITVSGVEIPNFRTHAGQIIAFDILKSADGQIGQPDFWRSMAQMWASTLVIKKGSQYVNKVNIDRSSQTRSEVEISARCSPIVARIVTYLKGLASLPDPYNQKMYKFTYDEEKFRVLAESQEQARKILAQHEPDITIVDFVLSNVEFASDS
jgi:hypothetical protein